jgi:hypothetical protein
MGNEPRLAFTVHHKGRKYPAGSTAEDIGPAAGQIGKHAWEDGRAPESSAVPEPDAPAGGTPAGSPPVPTPSPLPTPPDPADEGDGSDDSEALPAARAGRRSSPR